MASTKDKEESKSRKILKIMLNCIGAVILVTMCIVAHVCIKWKVDSNKVQKEYERNEKAAELQARENIDKYISNKYGFTPEIKEVETKWESEGDIFSGRSSDGHLSERSTALCSYNGKQFIVSVPNTQDYDITSRDACDNYQEDEIKEAIHNKIEEIANQEVECYFIEYGIGNYQFLYYGVNKERSSSVEYLVNNKFTGDNLGDILNDVFQAANRNEITFVCSNVDFSKDIKVDTTDEVKRLKPESVKQWFGSSNIDVSIFNLVNDKTKQEINAEMQGEDRYKLYDIFDYNDERIKDEIFYIGELVEEHEHH